MDSTSTHLSVTGHSERLRQYLCPVDAPGPPRDHLGTLLPGDLPDGTTNTTERLRLHISFSQPMQRQRAHEYLRLLDDDGHDVTEIMVDLGQELWSPDSIRLTVLLDPVAPSGASTRPLSRGPRLLRARTTTSS